MEASTIDNKTEQVNSSTANIPELNSYWNYEEFLSQAGISFVKSRGYLLVGKLTSNNCWVIYISISQHWIQELMANLLHYLKSIDAAFIIPENGKIHDTILDGGLGYHLIGKVIAIYPTSNIEALKIARELNEKTKTFNGPNIPTTRQLSNCVYTSFESPAVFGFCFEGTVAPQLKKEWPFKSIAQEKATKKSKWLKKKYFMFQPLKNDAKGNVYKGLDFTRWGNIKWCIIKKGNNCQCLDQAGRDIKDRLYWQFKVQTELAQTASLPQPIDFLEFGGDAFFIMENVEGSSYNDKISTIQKGKIWTAINQTEQSELLKYLLRIIGIIEMLHNSGYLHRDLNPENFIVKPDGMVVAIDIELCFNFVTKEPFPAFTLGTEGYMSAEQANCQIPVIEDDIYGLGGLMIRTLTGLSPTKFNSNNSDSLFKKLYFFIGNKRLCSTICACWNKTPAQRPTLASVKHNLELYLSLLITNHHLDKQHSADNDDTIIKKQIENALQSLWKYPLLGQMERWYSKTVVDEILISNDTKSYSWYPGIYRGAGGVLYTLAIADQLGYDHGCQWEILYRNFELIKSHHSEEVRFNPGMHFGSGGFAVVISLMIKNGILENSINNIDYINTLLSRPNDLTNLAEGIAGQGLSMFMCSENLQFPQLRLAADKIVEQLIHQQHADGSWVIKKHNLARKGIKVTGLYNGIAGIIHFLIQYSTYTYSETAKSSAYKGLKWLIKQANNTNGQITWPLNSQNHAIDPWLENGFTGIAYLFIKAYGFFKEPGYWNLAKGALLNHPKSITSNYLGHANGLAGLGEVYLDAYLANGDDEWLERASNIVKFFLNTSKEKDGNIAYWLEGSDNLPTADLMIGNCGIIHFLMRYQNQSKVKTPFLTI